MKLNRCLGVLPVVVLFTALFPESAGASITLTKTKVVSVNMAGGVAGDWNWEGVPSANGRYVAFSSNAPDIVPGDTKGDFDVFVRDLKASQTNRVSINTAVGKAKRCSRAHDIRYVG